MLSIMCSQTHIRWVFPCAAPHRRKQCVLHIMKCLLTCCSMLAMLIAGCASDPTRSSHSIDLFNGQDLSQWRNPSPGWIVAKSVSLNPENPHLFVIEPGSGIFVNGPEGKEQNLMSKT